MKFEDLISNEALDKWSKELDEIQVTELPDIDELVDAAEFDKLQKELDELNIDDLEAR